MSKRTRTSKIEKWIKEGRGSGIGLEVERENRTLSMLILSSTVFVN